MRYVAPIVDDAAAAGYDLDEADEAWLAARRAKVRKMALARGCKNGAIHREGCWLFAAEKIRRDGVGSGALVRWRVALGSMP